MMAGLLTHKRSLIATALGLILIATGWFALIRPLEAALPQGRPAPDFTTQAALAGKVFPFHLKAALQKGPVVLYFFPAAFTPGCTIEAHRFSDAVAEFRKAGASVVGVSADPIAQLQRFSVEACRNAFPVAVATPEMIRAYDVALPVGGRSNRTSFVIGRDGRIAYVYSAMKPDAHVLNTLAAVQKLR